MRLHPFTINARAARLAGFILLIGASGARAEAPALRFSASADQTAVDIGQQVSLTITLEGALDGVRVEPFTLPKELPVAAQQQSSSFSIRSGQAVRAITWVYLLVPQQAGSFQLGPFKVVQQGNTVSTDAINITVKKGVLPPTAPLQPRYSL